MFGTHQTGPDVKGRALICFWDGHLGVAPSLINAIQFLAEQGFAVDVVARDTGDLYSEAPFFRGVVNIQSPRAPSIRLGRLRSLPGPFGRMVRLAGLALDSQHFVAACRKIAAGKRYDVAIGVDMFGLIGADAAARISSITYLTNWSLEMYFRATLTNPLLRAAKRREIAITRRCDLIFIQDGDRAASLARENGLALDRFAFVPNAPAGFPAHVDRDFLRARLSIPLNRHIVLHAGMIHDDVCARELATSAATWPDRYCLVFHERAFRDASDPYLQKVMVASAGRALFSLRPVPLDKVDDIFASGWAGLVFYTDGQGPNFTEVALASGKLAFYLRNGVPVVVNALPSFVRLVKQWGCGVVVKDASEITAALDVIAADYDGFRSRALACFAAEFDFYPFFVHALTQIGLGDSA
jgi:hypothetical protein